MRLTSVSGVLRTALVAAAVVGILTTLSPTQSGAAEKTKKEWTMLLFLNGNNNLDSYAPDNLNQIEEVGSTDQVDFVVQWASLKNKKVQRLHMEKDSTPAITSPVIQDMGKVDMGNWKNLVDFIRWGVENYPAKKYFVVVWNHGNGWHLTGQSQVRVQDISFDDLTGNFISTAELGQAMEEASNIMGHKVELYASDACLMSMAEVASELQASVTAFAGSEEVEPATGWPYKAFMSRWVAKPSMEGKELGKVLMEEYVKSYSGGIYGREEVTFSVLDLSKMDALYRSVAALGREFTQLGVPARKSIMKVAANSQSFTYSDYVDLDDFLQRLLKGNIQDLSATGGLKETQLALRSTVVGRMNTGKYENVGGLAIWIPILASDYAQYIESYKKLRFHRETGWGDALAALKAN